MYMRVGLTLLVLGAVILTIAYGTAQFFSGQSIGEFPIYDRTTADVAAEIDVTESDFPVRIILTATGKRPMADPRGGRPYASFDVDYGNAASSENIRLVFPAEKEIDWIKPLTHTQSFLLNNSQPGHWRIRLIDTGFRQFKVDTAKANIKFRSEPPNIIMLIIGVTLAGLGFIIVLLAWLTRQRRA